MEILLNVIGIVVLLGALFLFSTDKKAIDKKMIIKALVIQFILAFLLVKFPLGQMALEKVSDFVTAVLGYGAEGLSFMFGTLADSSAPTGSIFAISVLGNIIFVSALVAVLYYLGVISAIVTAIGGIVGKVLGTSKVESFVAVANMFLGQTESPVLVSKYLKSMTESEIMLVLISGMGSMSATVLMGYAGMGIPMQYLLLGGALVPFGSILVSKMLLPEDLSLVGKSEVKDIKIDNKGDNPNLISAISQGASDGLQMVLGIGAALIAITGLVALVNGGLGIFGLSLEKILSVVFAPIGFLMGLKPDEISLAGQLLGSKLVLNEFVAFGQLGDVIKTLEPRTAMVLSVSLCGFANISSMGICISGISVFCPEKRNQLSKLAFRGMIGGFLVSILSALVVGLIAAL
ncbi:NupC/NupG family nucleoside CNT transporter [Romboutsia sp. Marseille-P6047]|uniref:NupC/NupG family nucleoside CNT transporter n=1 Tax=Romboutsia sp. Marseille-P6047 TaxID=2161817 RepID=UPI000821EE10|nr:nucleoside transporter C-terminal domain-containing protein [Romboutsia sp. Marseille-P6047]SCH93424.1 Nucleoside permease nupX [uncultured Clostridium sp.]